jgi:triphosphatase
MTDASRVRVFITWRLRREGRRWIQALTACGKNALARVEHEGVRPDASHDASEHAGTAIGDQLIALLRRAHADGDEPGVRFQTQCGAPPAGFAREARSSKSPSMRGGWY